MIVLYLYGLFYLNEVVLQLMYVCIYMNALFLRLTALIALVVLSLAVTLFELCVLLIMRQ